MPLALLWRVGAFFVPGGQIFAIGAAVVRFAGKFVYWLCADIADAFKEPWRFVVRTVCLVAVLLVGVYCGMDYMRDQRDVWMEAHAQILKDSRIADAKNKEQLNAALKAKAEAEAALMVRKVKTLPVAAPAAAPAKRVQQPKRSPTGAG